MSKDFLYGVKDIYQGALLAGTPMTINSHKFEENDVLIYFDSIQQITFSEDSDSTSAKGGFNNRDQVMWNTTKGVDCQLQTGRISKLGFGIINQTILNNINNIKSIRQFDTIKLDISGEGQLKHTPITDNEKKKIKVYEMFNGVMGREILDYSIEGSTIKIETTDITDILVDYWFYYNTNANSINIGEKTLNGFFKFVGKFYYSDEQGSSRKTAIIEIPKLIITGEFDINFSRNASPLVSLFQFKAVPLGDREKTKTVEVFYLDEDIDGEI